MRGGLTNNHKLTAHTLAHLQELPVAKYEAFKNDTAAKQTVAAKLKKQKKKEGKKEEKSDSDSEEEEASEEEEEEEESDSDSSVAT